MATNFPPGCSPAEIEELASLMSSNAGGKLNVQRVPVEEYYTNESGTASEALRKMAMGPLGYVRTVRGAFGPEFAAGPQNQISLSLNRMHNDLSDSVKQLNEAFQPLLDNSSFSSRFKQRFVSFPADADQELQSNLMKTSISAPAVGGTPSEQVAQNARNIMEEKYQKLVKGTPFQDVVVSPSDYFEEYLPLLQKKEQGQGLLWNNNSMSTEEQKFLTSLTDEQLKWLYGHETHGGLTNLENRGSVSINSYLNSMNRTAYLQSMLDNIETNYINPRFDIRFVRSGDGTTSSISTNDPRGYQMWKEYRHYLMGGATAADQRGAAVLSSLTESMGLGKTDVRSLYNMSSMVTALGYAGGMGGRAASIIRQFGQMIPIYAEFGAKDMTAGMKRVLDDISTGGGFKDLEDKGYFVTHLDSIVKEMGAGQRAGQIVNQAIQPLMTVFNAADRFVRAVTARTAEKRFTDVTAAQEPQWSNLTGTKEIKQEVERLWKMGRTEDAQDLYVMQNLNELQYGYGKGNRSAAFRGAIGNLTGMFMSYPLNTFEMMNSFVQRALRDPETGKLNFRDISKNDPMPLVRMLGATMGAMYAGSELLDADLRQSMFFSAIPNSMLFPKTIMDSWKVGVGTADYLTGSLFMTGTTDFKRQQLADSLKQFARDGTTFLPGYYAINDYTKMINEGSVARAFALTPKAAVLNQQAKARSAANRSSGGGGFTGY